jgi:hypothetical protein
MATDQELERVVTNAIQIVRRKVKQTRQAHPQVKHRIEDYPAMVVACSYRRGNEVFWGQSKSPVNHIYEDRLHERLEALAPIGTKRQACKNTIGACAEPHAADMVLKNAPRCNLNELQFSSAYRPRTAKRKRYCRNCKDTFPEVL